MSDKERLANNRLMNEILLASNVAGALFLAAFIYIRRNWISVTPVNDSTYLFLRSAYRVIDFLGLQSVNHVATGAVRRQMPGRSEALGVDILVIVTVLGASAVLILLLRLLRQTRIYRLIFSGVTLPLLLFTTPICYLYVSWLTWNWPWREMSPPGSFFRQGLALDVFLAEFLCFCVSLRYFRLKTTPKWMVTVLIALHCTFWAWVLWSETQILIFPMYSRALILVLFPFSALVYLWRGRPASEATDGTSQSREGTWVWGLAIAVIVLAGAVWHPARNVAISYPLEPSSVKVVSDRGPCYGLCAAYTITLRGDGQVEYAALGRTGIPIKKSGIIQQEKVTQILQALDKLEFMTLEGRAFFWAFDTPSVAVQAAVGGKSKRVVSDSLFVGSHTGRQARFVQAANEIDTILASTKWTQCGDVPCANPQSTP
jgi:hypothetical protein